MINFLSKIWSDFPFIDIILSLSISFLISHLGFNPFLINTTISSNDLATIYGDLGALIGTTATLGGIGITILSSSESKSINFVRKHANKALNINIIYALTIPLICAISCSIAKYLQYSNLHFAGSIIIFTSILIAIFLIIRQSWLIMNLLSIEKVETIPLKRNKPQLKND